MKCGLKNTIIFFALLLLYACADDESKLENKWQLRWYVYGDGSETKVDSIFFNFQKSSYSAICVLPNGGFETFFGNYSFNNDKVYITLLPDYTTNENYIKYLNWENGRREFKIEELTSNVLRLNYRDTISVFRKY